MAARSGSPGIYGTVITGAIIATTEESVTVTDVVIQVLVTILVYWAAERWSQSLGSQVPGEPLSAARVRRIFAEGWPMVEAAYLPLIVIIVASLCGLDADHSIGLGLIAVVVSLVVIGAVASRRAGLTGWALTGSTVVGGLFGVILIGLKAIVG